MPKDKIQIWIDELRSGKWKQGSGQLQLANSFCCFGVACKLFAPDDGNRDGELFGDMPTTTDGAPEWLIKINDDFDDVTGVSLANLNDEGVAGLDPFTFDEIADLLQAVYIEEVLK